MQSLIPLDWTKAVAVFASLCGRKGLQTPTVTTFDDLVVLALDEHYTVLILIAFRPVFLEIQARWILGPFQERRQDVFSSLAVCYALFPASSALIEHFLLQQPDLVSKTQVPAQTLLALYRLLSTDRSRYAPYILPETLYMHMASQNKTVRGLAVLNLALFSEASEKTRQDWLIEYLGEEPDEVRYLGLHEAQRIADIQTLASTEAEVAGEGFELDLSLLVANVAGVLVPKINPAASQVRNFVPTKESLHSLKAIANGLLADKPILLTGPAGSGKTFYVDTLGLYLRPTEDIVRIHLGDQTDSKSLIGTYSTGEKPGTFEWRAGVLTSAVTQGKWVLIEDLDKAPTDVLSVLLPLLEKRQLLLSSRNEVIRAKAGFQLFATVTGQTHDFIGQRHWHHLEFNAMDDAALLQILTARFPRLTPLAPKFVEVYLAVQDVCAHRHNLGRQISARDLFKWAQRVQELLEHTLDATQAIPVATYDDIFREAVCCFASFMPNPETVLSMADLIGEYLEIGPSKVKPLIMRHTPSISESTDVVRIGRAELVRRQVSTSMQRDLAAARQNFALTGHSLRLLEQIAVATSLAEPLLLVGETGTGKTTIVQYLANLTNRKLIVVNISQQMETGDLVGGFKPVDAKMLAGTLLEEFEELFDSSFSRAKNQQFMEVLAKSIKKNLWTNVIKLWREAFRMVGAANEPSKKEPAKKRRRIDVGEWQLFMERVDAFEVRLKQLKNSILFQFIEGLLVKAVRKGYWILLDEINLAPADTLEGIADLLVNPPSLTLLEKGDKDAVVRANSEFRLFACMNPATDVGKRELPPAVRSRFTEIYVDSPDRDLDDLRFIIDRYIGRLKMADQHVVNDVAQLFVEAKELANNHQLVDGAGQRPHFSIRTLSRTLVYACAIAPTYGLRRALFEGFCMSFLTVLDKKSNAILDPVIRKHTLARLGNAKSVLATLPPRPTNGDYIQFRHYWLRLGQFPVSEDDSYIITPSVEHNLLNLVRATATKIFPVLIQGPTSSGKTSMVNYLANRSGHKFVRINNHEHTDLQEYLGTYVSDDSGKLVFQEGILVEAVRNGYWIVLDELNLAPTDVLEALNRLLDDNRELLIPETQEVVKPHPDFMLFATQNPPGLYAGRKVLSRAFRNRFLELHFDDIPQDELEQILKDRCKIAPSYAKKIVDVYRDLSLQRQSARLFEQKNSFATLRDLFRWAMRPAVGYEQLALNGYLLLGERVRSVQEKTVVKDSLERVMRVKLDINFDALAPPEIIDKCSDVVWTSGMKRLLVLVLEALKQNEPVLLVGETGCGKTTICQVLSHVFHKQLHIVNAHQNTETGDIIGAQRPVRNRSELLHQLEALLRPLLASAGVDVADLSVAELKTEYKAIRSTLDPEQTREANAVLDKSEVLFEWSDGSLVTALKQGSYFLLDEISLADDSVLERLNSVLEPERSLLLPEKGAVDISVTAKQGFEFFATMNPGGDYGKKELSPALRNRFTEIWVPSMDNFDDVEMIVRSKLAKDLEDAAPAIVKYAHWFGTVYGNGDATSGVISLRDILHWVQFVNVMAAKMGVASAVFNGGCMVFVDSVGSNALAHLAQSEHILREHRFKSVRRLAEIVSPKEAEALIAEYFAPVIVEPHAENVQVGQFELAKVDEVVAKEPFSLNAPTTAMNAMRVVRAMAVNKPILLEGSPGVGKTSLVSALASISGHKLTRINLSDQTDLIDLFGSDTPAEGQNAGEFVWRDAPFLRAMQVGEWVLLDEMNLASQAVLEGLNSCLDHRGEAYIPELDRTFKCHPDFMVFAAQNPQYQGGGRKGLPKSFVNRFSVVYVDSLSLVDLRIITQHLYPQVPQDISEALVDFIEELNQEVGIKRAFGQLGGPFEFNLRDTMRWFGLATASGLHPSEYFDLIVRQRFRTANDREKATALFVKHFGTLADRTLLFNETPALLQAGHSVAPRTSRIAKYLSPFTGHLQANTLLMETAMTCVEHAWPMILTGPTDSGKTSFLRFLAFSYGATLKELSMNADIDSTDLLGEFDQVQYDQQLARIWTEIDEYVGRGIEKISASEIALLQAATERNLEQAESLLSSTADEPAERILAAIRKFRASDFSRPRFQWFDGALVQAVEKGYWLILDNANLCNPSVLDRLNSLLEPNGTLLINECAEESGEPRKVVPHKDFRLFLTVNPKYGELSRAMRNRGVEVFVDTLAERATQFDRKVLGMPAAAAGDISSDLQQLALVSQQPVSAHLPITDSEARDLALYVDAVDATGKPHWLLVSFVSHALASLLKPAYCEKITAVADTVRLAELTPYIAQVEEYYASCAGASLMPLNPIDGSLLFVLQAFLLRHELRVSLNSAISSAKTASEKDMSLLQLSIHSRTKETINCVDVYGFFSAILSEIDPTHAPHGLFDLLQEFMQLIVQPNCDVSRVPIYRDLIEELAGNVPALKLLGIQFDFKKGGFGMERLWQAFAQGGFAGEEQWHINQKLVGQAKEFDEAASKLFTENVSEIANVRSALCSMIVDSHWKQVSSETLQLLSDGIERVKSALSTGKEQHAFHFVNAFKDITQLLEKWYWAEPAAKLQDALTTLSYYAITDTEHLSQFFWPVRDSIVTPLLSTEHIDVRYSASQALLHCNQVPSSQYEAAMQELKVYVSTVVQHSNKVGDSTTAMATVLRRLVALVQETVPELDLSLALAELDAGNVAQAWITYGDQLITAYVSPAVFDPAIRQHVKYDRYCSLKSSYAESIEYWQQLRGVFVGDKPTGIDEKLLAQQRDLQKEPVPSVFRPKKSAISHIYREVNAAMSMLRPDHHRSLNHEQLQVWNGNVDRFVGRLQQFSGYKDLLSILRSAVWALKFGLNLKITPVAEQSLYWLADPADVGVASQLARQSEASRALISSTSAKDRHAIELQILAACSLHGYVPLARPIDRILKQFYHNWSMERLRAEEKSREDETIYKFADEEEEAEKDFQKMFPDYEGDEIDDVVTEADTHHSLATVYSEIFLGTNKSLAAIVEASVPVLGRVSGPAGLADVSSELPSVVLSLAEALNAAVTTEKFNFYLEPCFAQAKTAIALTRRISFRIGEFLSRWPEHDTLLIINRACQELAEFPISTPLARYLAKLEQIHHFLNEWQRFASKDVSVMDLMGEVSSLIVSWRRIELSTWPSLFDFEQLKTEKNGAQFWYYLYENLVGNPVRLGEESLDLAEVVRLLVLFLSESTFGQYAARINLLKAFKEHTKQLPLEYMKSIANCIDNVLAFYAQYTHLIEKRIAEKKKALKKEIQEVILLASWRDVNVLALKQSAQRSHRSLYKIVRKFREFISQKVSALVEEEGQAVAEGSVPMPLPEAPMDSFVHLETLKTDPLAEALWAARPAHLQNVERRAEMMRGFAEQVAAAEIPTLGSLASSTLEHAEQLRKETPKELTKDNKKLLSALRAEKTQLLIAVLKDLKDAGLRISVRKDVLAEQEHLSQVLAATPCLPAIYSTSDAFFYRTVELLPRLRSAVSSAACDVPAADLRRAMNFGENLFSSILRHRRVAGDVALAEPLLASTAGSLNAISALLDSDDSLVAVPARENKRSKQYAQSLSSLSKYVADVLISVEAIGFRGTSSLSTIVSKSKTISGIETSASLAAQSEINSDLAKEVQRLQASSAPAESLVAPVVAKWLSLAVDVDVESFAFDASLLNSKVVELCSNVLVAIQSVYKISEQPIPEDDWFTAAQAMQEKLMRSLHAGTIAAKLQDLVETLKTIGSANTKLAAAFAGSALPFVQGYMAMVKTCVAKFAVHQQQTCKAGYQLLKMLNSLATEGFCQPQEPDDGEDDDSSELQDGTGLGDGSGAQSNSKDEEQDEDLTETAQTENKEQDKEERNEDEEDNAVEMEGDMAGNLEDVNEKSDDEQDQDDDNEEKDMDDEVGDIDDLDPNAVDEKMWDDERKDEKEKEKHTDENVKGQEDDMEAGDEDQDPQEKPEGHEGGDPKEAESGDEGSDEGSDEDDAGVQEDDVQQKDGDDLEENVDEGEALDLPEDMNLDGDDKGEEENDDVDMPDDGLDADEPEGAVDEQDGEQGEAEPEGDEANPEEEIDADAEPEEGEPEEGEPQEGEPEEAGEEGEGEEADAEPEPEPEGEENAENMENGQGEVEAPMDVDTEGLHGPDDNQDDVDAQQSTTTEQQSKQSGTGANQETTEEQDAADMGESAAAAMDMADASKDEDQGRKNANDSLKELGDAMKEFYRRHREIQERSERDEAEQEESANSRPDEVEHVGAEDSHDTQALGASTADDKQDIDQNMAIDEDEPEPENQETLDEVKAEEPAAGGAGDTEAAAEDGEPEEAMESVVGSTKEREIKDESDSEMEVDEAPDYAVGAEHDGDSHYTITEGRELWREYDQKTQELTLILCEQLRLILEPTLATKLRGDYKTGKRLNMKRIIPYIASQFKKDKIWLRRTRPSKRQYQVMLALDDSKSMGEPVVSDLAFQAIALVAKALSQVEAGQLAITRFGEETEVVHPFEKSFNAEAGADALRWFGFDQERTDVNKLLDKSLDMFEKSRALNGPSESWQLEIIISDGICEDHERLRRLVRKAHDQQIMVVFIVLDAVNKDGSILDMSQVNYAQDENGNMSLQVDRYMDEFPFEYYVLVRNIGDLPGVLASVLRQYFQAVE